MMQQDAVRSVAVAPVCTHGAFSPAAMASHLRATEPEAAVCFAQAMYGASAWANESWGKFWADVIRLVAPAVSAPAISA